jgi:phage tail sheath gpL-like
VVQPTGGATDPDLAATSGTLAAVVGADYTHYASPYLDADNCGDLKTHLETISGGTEMRPATAWLGYTDEIGIIDSVKSRCGAAGATLNHWRVSVAYLPGTYSLPFEVGAAYMAVAAGQNDPAQPLNTLVLTGIHAPPVTSRLTRTVQEDLLDNGVAPLEVIPGEQVAIVRAISTYTRNAQGVEDPARLDMTTATSLDYVRKAERQRVSVKFPQPKKTERFKKALRTELLDVLYQCETLEIVENVDTWKDYLIITDDLQDLTRVNARIPASIVRGAHVIALRIDLL